MKAILAFLSLSALLYAQPALDPPRIGFVQDSRHAVYPVNGLAGNFLLGEAAWRGIVSAAFSGSFGLLKTDSKLLAVDRRGKTLGSVDAPPGPALFAFAHDGSPALAYLPESRTLLVWREGSFAPVRLDPVLPGSGKVLAIGLADARQAALVVEREDGLWELRVRLATAGVTSQVALIGVTGPLLLLANGGLIYAETGAVVLRNPDGPEKRIPARLPSKLAFQQMGGDWIAVRDLAGRRAFAVCVTGGREQSYVLPEARP